MIYEHQQFGSKIQNVIPTHSTRANTKQIEEVAIRKAKQRVQSILSHIRPWLFCVYLVLSLHSKSIDSGTVYRRVCMLTHKLHNSS